MTAVLNAVMIPASIVVGSLLGGGAATLILNRRHPREPSS